jgi:hypothetical protein
MPEASPAVQVPLEPADAPAPPPPQPDRIPDGDQVPTVDGLMAAYGRTSEPQPTRDAIPAAFKGTRQPEQPKPATPPPVAPQPRPWFAGPQAREVEPEFSDEAWDEFCVGFRFNTLKWNVRRLGPEPGNPDCRAPKEVLRRNGLL